MECRGIIGEFKAISVDYSKVFVIRMDVLHFCYVFGVATTSLRELNWRGFILVALNTEFLTKNKH